MKQPPRHTWNGIDATLPRIATEVVEGSHPTATPAEVSACPPEASTTEQGPPNPLVLGRKMHANAKAWHKNPIRAHEPGTCPPCVLCRPWGCVDSCQHPAHGHDCAVWYMARLGGVVCRCRSCVVAS